MSQIRVGINGFGRIGRAVARIIQSDPDVQLATVNDIDPNVENHAYLFKYDSTYGRFEGDVSTEKKVVNINGNSVQFYTHDDIDDVPWERHDVDVVVAASGVPKNVQLSHKLIESNRVKKVVVTHEPNDGLDHTVIFGVNEDSYDRDQHDVVGASICDANALAPALSLLDEMIGVAQGFVTTLHPWLPYQNVLDGSIQSVSGPSHSWDAFQLARASDKNLIPKQTTAIHAVGAVNPDIARRVHAMSFRVPTAIVTASDVTLRLEEETTLEEVNAMFECAAEDNPQVFGYTEQPLVSSDFKQINQSLVFDSRWTDVQQGDSLRLILWYDNEWGYSQRVVDLVRLVG